VEKSLITVEENKVLRAPKKKPREGSRMDYVTVKVPADLIKIIDEKVVGKYGYRSRAEFIKDAIRDKLKEFAEK
jgi:hypothetical protein